MSPASPDLSFAVRFRPVGPWRFGPDSGARDRVDLIYHSDALFSAVCSAMSQLGLAEEWLAATATSANAPAVRFSSFFPFIGDTLLVVPPRSLWPPPESTKIRYKGAHFVPLPVVESLLSDKAIDEDRWAVDGESECLVLGNSGRGPFRVALRSSAGVDRLHNRVGRRRCEARYCCWPIPAWAASARAAGAVRKRPSGKRGLRRNRLPLNKRTGCCLSILRLKTMQWIGSAGTMLRSCEPGASKAGRAGASPSSPPP